MLASRVWFLELGVSRAGDIKCFWEATRPLVERESRLAAAAATGKGRVGGFVRVLQADVMGHFVPQIVAAIPAPEKLVESCFQPTIQSHCSFFRAIRNSIS